MGDCKKIWTIWPEEKDRWTIDAKDENFPHKLIQLYLRMIAFDCLKYIKYT